MGNHFGRLLLDCHHPLHWVYSVPLGTCLCRNVRNIGLRSHLINLRLVDSCLDLCPLTPLDRHDGPRMGFNEHAPGGDYEFRWDNGTTFPRWSLRSRICPCRGLLYDLLLSPCRDGPSIWSFQFLLPARQLLCLSLRIRSCPCQDVFSHLEASIPCWQVLQETPR